MTANLSLQMTANAISMGLMYVLVALGLTLIFGVMDVLNFAHGEFYMMGAFGTWWFTSTLGVNYLVSVVIGMGVVGFIGMVVERLLVRPTYRNPFSTVVLTIGLSLLFQFLAVIIFGATGKTLPTPFAGVSQVLGVKVANSRVVASLIGAIIVVVLILFVQRTKLGRAMRAVQQDRSAAAMVGVNIGNTYTLCFAIGAALAAGAGGLLGTIFTVDPTMGTEPMLKAFIMIIIGGLGSIPGALVGGLLLGFIDSFAGTLLASAVANMAAFAVLFLFLVLKPRGIFGQQQK